MRHRTSTFALFVAFFLTVAWSPGSQADTAHADFNDVDAGQLRDQSGGEGFKNDSPWTGQTSMVRAVPGGLTAPPATGYSLKQGGESRILRMNHTEERVVHRPLASSLRRVVWGTFLVQVPDGGSAGLGFNTGLTHSTFSAQAIVAEAGTDQIDLVYRIGGKDKDRAAGAIKPGEPTLILYRIVYDSKSPDKGFAAWVNPDLLAPLPKPDIFSVVIGNNDIHSVTVGGMGGGQLDAIRISSDPDGFTDVTGQLFLVIPEPTSLAPLSIPEYALPVVTPLNHSRPGFAGVAVHTFLLNSHS